MFIKYVALREKQINT